jgi:pimeloyl-ACP methyl ester carboxylesterase
MMKKLISSILLAAVFLFGISSGTNCQPREEQMDPELSQAVEQYYKQTAFGTLSLNGHDVVHYGYLKRKATAKPMKPLLVYINGSGYQSAFGLKVGERWVQAGNPVGFMKALFPDYDILAPEKTNVTIGGDHSHDNMVISTYTLENRVRSAAAVIDTILDKTDYPRIFILGISEGAYILPRLYQELRHKAAITALVIWGSGGLSQYEEFNWLAGSEVSMDPGMKKGYKSLESVASDIKANPNAIDKEYFGFPYKRWASFLWYSPLDDLVDINIPILLMHGTEDECSSVESSRLVERTFRKLGKKNLTYYEYAGITHGPETEEECKRFYGDLMTWLQGLEGKR